MGCFCCGKVNVVLCAFCFIYFFINLNCMIFVLELDLKICFFYFQGLDYKICTISSSSFVHFE